MNRRKPMNPLWLVVTGWMLLCSCETLPVQGSARVQEDAQRDFIQGPVEPSGSIKRRVHLVVPFFPDNADQCGPATLASMLTYWGIPSDPRTLKEEIYLRRLRGTLPIDLLLAAQARGLQTEGAGGTLDRVKTELAADRPVVALLNLGWTLYPQGHYVVVTGYDDQRQGLYVHSGLARDVFVPYEAFLNNWEKSGRWMLQMRPAKRHDSAHE
jgi:ABC-type bacteriocin/lantibiotic exporter with double-glycine peptidase domain